MHWSEQIVARLESAGHGSPWLFLALFLAGSLLTIWRLEAMSAGGLEGTVLGTVIMPYCTGMGNLIFAYVMGRRGSDGADVMTNCLVNNVTNMTLLIGLPAVLWGMNIVPQKKQKGESKKQKKNSANQINRLSLLLTLLAVLFFTGVTWVLGRKGKFDFDDGLILVGLFFFWQCFHVYDVLKTNAQQNKSLSWMLPVDLALLAAGAYAVYISTDWLVNWTSHSHGSFVNAKHLGWLSGWLTVLPNGILAFYYGWRKQPEVVYTSQVGDGHICIPFCIGVFALFKTFAVPKFFEPGVELLVAATAVHIFFVTLLGRLPRFAGLLLVAAYGWFVYKGLGG